MRESLSVLRAILEWLGFVINDEKSVEIPTQQLEFLGFMIDSNLMTLSLTEKKRFQKFVVVCSVQSEFQPES